MKKMYKKSSLFIFLLMPFFEVHGGQFAVRARENFETTKFKGDLGSLDFQGFTPTINLYYEEPYKLSYGASVNVPLGTIEEKDGRNTVLGDEIKVWQLGADIKYFPVEELKGFVRSTATYQLLDTKVALDNLGGYGLYVGAGWEFPLFDLFSLAPEVGYRHSEFRIGSADTVLISIGVHFYQFAKK